MKRTLRTNVAAAVMMLAPFGAALWMQPAAAQDQHRYRVAEARDGKISSMTLNSDGGLRPGATLHVQVRGTPGARWANISLSDEVRVSLRERAPGDYVGSYVVRRGDHLDPTRLMTVRAGWGDAPVSLAFNYPTAFRTQAMGNAPASSAEVNSFNMWPREADRLEPGRVVHFRMQGTPHSRAWVTIPGVERRVQLNEERPGQYVGSYTIRRSDDRRGFSEVVGKLRAGDERVAIHLNGQMERDFRD
jgi:hypothetical protein